MAGAARTKGGRSAQEPAVIVLQDGGSKWACGELDNFSNKMFRHAMCKKFATTVRQSLAVIL
jgi:hypothetical protein